MIEIIDYCFGCDKPIKVNRKGEKNFIVIRGFNYHDNCLHTVCSVCSRRFGNRMSHYILEGHEPIPMAKPQKLTKNTPTSKKNNKEKKNG